MLRNENTITHPTHAHSKPHPLYIYIYIYIIILNHTDTHIQSHQCNEKKLNENTITKWKLLHNTITQIVMQLHKLLWFGHDCKGRSGPGACGGMAVCNLWFA